MTWSQTNSIVFALLKSLKSKRGQWKAEASSFFFWLKEHEKYKNCN